MAESTNKLANAPRPLSPVLSSPPLFDHERLDVYQLELQFVRWTADLLEEVTHSTATRTAEVSDQLDRASLSALLNTAEGNGKRRRQGRAKFFDDARGSATECAGCLDAMVAKRVVPESRILDGKQLLARIISMLCRLIERFETHDQLRDEPTEANGTLAVQNQPVNYRTNSQGARTRTRTRTRTKA